MNEKMNDVSEVLKNLTMQDFLAFGLHDLAYIREVDTQEGPGYAVRSADGQTLSVIQSREEAESLIAHNELRSVTVH